MFSVVEMPSKAIRLAPNRLGGDTKNAINAEIDQKYPNRILTNVGLVISRFGDCRVQDGVVSVADGGSVTHRATFRLIVFRPYVGQVCTGYITRSTPEGVYVTLGFFDDVFIPAYWMLRPSRYDAKRCLWVWEPEHTADEDGEGESSHQEETKETDIDHVKREEVDVVPPDADVFEMEHGAEIRFKVMSLNFTTVTKRGKGEHSRQQTTTAFESVQSDRSFNQNDANQSQVRCRSSSIGLEEDAAAKPTMSITASICEDGLGLTSWWLGDDEETDEKTAESVTPVYAS